MQIAAPQTLGFLAIGALIVWRMYARFRRMVGRQRLSKYRAPITLTIYTLLLVFLVERSLPQPQQLLWLAAGLIVGIALGFFGLKHTRFEAIRGEGLFY